VEWIRRRSWSFIAWSVFTAAVLFLRLGSFEDRIVVGVFWLSLVLLPVERIVHQIAAFMARNVLPRYVLLSSIGLIWAWATARFRGGGGPFHLQLAGIWRGYPFPFEEWWWSDAGVITWWRDIYWFGLIGDFAPFAAALFFTFRWLHRSGAPVDRLRTLVLVVFTIAFTWLNIEPWIAGLPLTVAGPPPPFQPRYLHFEATLTAGFPLIYWNGVSSEPQFNFLAANVAIGLIAWAALYWARSLVHIIRVVLGRAADTRCF
jgi:hypothetical protein